MKKIVLLALVLSSITFSMHAHTTVKPLKSNQDQRDVKNFNGIVTGGPIEVIITMGNTESLKFEGDADAISTLVAEVKGNILIIRPEVSWKSWSKKYENKKIIAHVTAKNITSLTISGDGSINVIGTVKASELATTLSGSGGIKAIINTDKLTGTMSGSGSLNFSGSADAADVKISGSGKMDGKALAVNYLNAKISGSGSVYAKVSNNIKAMISGSGHVYYSGDASIEQTVIGSGGINKL